MSELGKPFLKKSDQKKTENECQNSACGRKTTSEKRKFGWNKKLGLEWTMNGLVKPLRKNRYKKPLARKRILVQTPFSHSTLKFKIRAKKITPQNHSLFRSTSCFGVTKITTPIWLQKSWKCVNRSLKKRQRPNTIQNSLNCKKEPGIADAAIKQHQYNKPSE